MDAEVRMGQNAFMDKYQTFQELRSSEQEGVDFRVKTRLWDKAKTAVIAPHGGNIEPGTSEAAWAIADKDLNLAVFEGTKPAGNSDLHLTSTNFDEPRCIEVVKQSEMVLALHGERGSQRIVYLGGSDGRLCLSIAGALSQAGFSVTGHGDNGLRGISPENICNRGKSGKGVQLELARGLRESFFHSLNSEGRKTPTRSFADFVAAVRKGLQLGGAI